MPRRSRSSGLMIVAAAAVLGYGLIWLPPAVAQSYDAIYRVNPHLALAYLCAIGALAASLVVLILVKGFQMWSRSRRKARPAKLPSAMTASEIRKEITQRQTEAAGYMEALPERRREELGTRLQSEQTKLEAQTLEIVAFGTISSGKSSLLNALIGQNVFVTDARGGTTAARNETDWPGHGRVRLVDTPGLGEMHGADRGRLADGSARTADLVLYVTDGVLRDFEFQVLRDLGRLEKRVVLCLNKEDLYAAQDRDTLLSQLMRQLKDVVPADDFVAVRANPAVRTRVRVTAHGEEIEEQVPVPPDVSALANRMLQIVEGEGQRLLLANLLIRSRGLVAETKLAVQESLDRQAREVVGSYMWQAGGAAALSPFPLLDIAAGLTISYKMVIDIAEVYRHKVDLDSAREMVAQAGKNLLATAGATLATPSVAALAASTLKTIPGVGTIAGGVLQGLVQALVTRWIGTVFIAWFREDMLDRLDLGTVAIDKWKEVSRPSELARLVQEGVKRLGRREPERSGDYAR